MCGCGNVIGDGCAVSTAVTEVKGDRQLHACVSPLVGNQPATVAAHS